MYYISPKSGSILEILLELFPESSKNTLRSWISKERIFINGEKITKSQNFIKKGKEIFLSPKKKYLPFDIEVLYEDQDLIVINKPVGILSVDTPYDKSITAHQIIKEKFPGKKVFPVHRLDKDTSGVMVFALSLKAKNALKALFHDHIIIREYHAIVEGKIEEEKGTWTCFLEEGKNFKMRLSHSSKGKLAKTHFERIYVSKSLSYLKVTLETGRKNQIRIQAKYAGHPVIGDKKYDSDCNPIGRLGLHAAKLGFTHPTTGKKLEFTSSPPESFQQLFKKRSHEKNI